MSKEYAISLLKTAKSLNDPEDIKRFVESAIGRLEPEQDVVPGIEMVAIMISEALNEITKNAPDWQDSPDERAMKLCILEKSLFQIKEYTSMGIKIRYQAVLDNAGALQNAKANRSLKEYEKAEIQVSLEGGSTGKTTLDGREKAVEVAAKIQEGN